MSRQQKLWSCSSADMEPAHTFGFPASTPEEAAEQFVRSAGLTGETEVRVERGNTLHRFKVISHGAAGCRVEQIGEASEEGQHG